MNFLKVDNANNNTAVEFLFNPLQGFETALLNSKRNECLESDESSLTEKEERSVFSSSTTATSSSDSSLSLEESIKVQTRRRRVQFDDCDVVIKIPHFRDYSDEERDQIWIAPDALDESIERCTIEFAYEGHNWRNAIEESQFYRCGNGKLFHPAIVQHVLEKEKARMRREAHERALHSAEDFLRNKRKQRKADTEIRPETVTSAPVVSSVPQKRRRSSRRQIRSKKVKQQQQLMVAALQRSRQSASLTRCADM